MSDTNDMTISYDEAKRVTTDFMNPAVWTQMKGMAETFRTSGALPKALDTVPKLMMVMQAGLEIGLKPVESINSLYIVNGMVNVWGKAAVARITRGGYRIAYKDETDATVTAVVTKGDEKYEETYSFALASDSGYTQDSYGKVKVGWKVGVNRKLKLRYGAISIILKTYLPHLLSSVAGIVEVEEDVVISEAAPNSVKETGVDESERVINRDEPKPKTGSMEDFIAAQKAAKSPKTAKSGDKPQSPPKVEVMDKSKAIEGEVVTELVEEKESDVVPGFPHTADPEWQKAKRRYFVTIKEYGVSHEDLKAVVGVESLNEIPLADLQQLINRIETNYTQVKSKA